MSLEVIKRSRIKIQDKGNNLYLVQVDLTNRENCDVSLWRNQVCDGI